MSGDMLHHIIRWNVKFFIYMSPLFHLSCRAHQPIFAFVYYEHRRADPHRTQGPKSTPGDMYT